MPPRNYEPPDVIRPFWSSFWQNHIWPAHLATMDSNALRRLDVAFREASRRLEAYAARSLPIASSDPLPGAPSSNDHPTIVGWRRFWSLAFAHPTRLDKASADEISRLIRALKIAAGNVQYQRAKICPRRQSLITPARRRRPTLQRRESAVRQLHYAR